ncbi:hypothetical protein Hdeb2414_s0007g00242301 [Helianthus debilis subsp. tardiflorus]
MVRVISALDFIKSDDTSDVFTDAPATEGEDVVVSCAEHRFEGLAYVNVRNVKGFVKVAASKAFTRRSTRRKGAGQPASSETVDLSDDVEVPEDVEVPVEGKKGELPLVVGKDNKAEAKNVAGLKPSGKTIEGSSNVDPGEIYVPGWKVTVADSFKSSSVCEDVLTHFAPHTVRDSRSSMDDDQMLAKMILGASNLSALLPKGISRFRKRLQEYEVGLCLNEHTFLNSSHSSFVKVKVFVWAFYMLQVLFFKYTQPTYLALRLSYAFFICF